ncbi:MAG: alpha-galactosidase [Planctomycetes bacterium]|nr:alpha-galactosidase [Planctomycetota bacterium]
MVPWVFFLVAVAGADPSARIEEIPADGEPADRLRLEVAGADTSESFGEAYRPERICDGDRRTKWVAGTRPTEEKPQWVILRLAGGAQDVGAIAVFGEGLDNDGVLDADLQVEIDGAFRTIASVRDAPSPSWLAVLDPVRTGRIRLLVFRSAGPTDHTDVWEIEIYGPILPPEEIARIRAERALRIRAQIDAGIARDDAARILVAGDGVIAGIERETGAWTAVWDGVDAAIAGARFRIETSAGRPAEGAPETAVRSIEDPLGEGTEVAQAWRGSGLRVEREIRVYDRLAAVTIGGRIRNESAEDVRLDRALLIDHCDVWRLGDPEEPPAAVFLEGYAYARTRPFDARDAGRPARARSYRSGGVLSLARREPAAALTIAHARADEAAPDLAADWRLDEGGRSLSATMRFLGHILGPGESVELNRLYIAADTDPYRSLESCGDAMARFAPHPARTGATALWCSWYAHRMAMTEEKVLANAAVAARHLKPLGFEIIQLDHGWQRGDITGDWVPNERFPHGLAWLANELRARHGFRLGVWIAPTDVAETSDTFRAHPEWMLRGDDGKPRVNWRWYWVPNPNCYELDATCPGAARFIEDTFRRLTAEGVSYYKIDFIASAGGEHFIPNDPKATRGWSVLRRAMEAVRRGAGEDAWIRYCQTPPVLSAGLANSAYGGQDTLDAGIPGRFDVLRDNAHILAASFWLNDRPYHREVCDMSIRMQGSIEEVRVRAAIMTLANASISFSDELSYLPPSRIRVAQQCLPPGNPPMRPIDLHERDIPSVWHLPVRTDAEAWDVVGLFNLEAGSAPRAVPFDRLGIGPDEEVLVFEFWEGKSLGVRTGGIEIAMPPRSSRILSIRRKRDVPQLIGTDMHLLMGYHEVAALAWDAEKATLSGIYRRMPGIAGKAYIHVPDGYAPRFDFPLSNESARLTHVEGPVWMQEIEFTDRDCVWSIPFAAAEG